MAEGVGLFTPESGRGTRIHYEHHTTTNASKGLFSLIWRHFLYTVV